MDVALVPLAIHPEFKNASLDVRKEARPLDGIKSTGWWRAQAYEHFYDHVYSDDDVEDGKKEKEPRRKIIDPVWQLVGARQSCDHDKRDPYN